MNEITKSFVEAVAGKLIELLRAGTAPWQKPWQAGETQSVLPFNPTTGKRYKGINALQLMSEGHADQRWMTYRQAAAVDAQVRKGEKGTAIQYWKFADEQIKKDAAGNPILDARGEPVKASIQLERPRVFFATVFNAEQIDGLPPIAPRKEQTWSAVERAEQILRASGAVIITGEQDRAFYRPATDSIHLPDKSRFENADGYYATALHELGHWTGHETRLDRDLANPFGSEGYAREELRAEIASMILGDQLGIGHDPGQHASYVASWIKVLQNDPLEIFRASADAEKIHDYVIGLEQKQVEELTTEEAMNIHVGDNTRIRARLEEDLIPQGVLLHFQEHQYEQQSAQNAQASSGYPEAFLDDDGVLRDTDTAGELLADWTGVIKEYSEFWFAGHLADERVFILLAATTLKEAESEGARAGALTVDISHVLNDLGDKFGHVEAFRLPTLDENMRSFKLTTVQAVTGNDPAYFYQKALDRLSLMSDSTVGPDRVRLEHSECELLAQQFTDKAELLLMPVQQRMIEAETIEPRHAPAGHNPEFRAEEWTFSRLEHGSLARVLDNATLVQLDRVQEILSAMEPLDISNPFWLRHELPMATGGLQEKIDVAKAMAAVRLVDAGVAEARLELVTGHAFKLERAGDIDAFERKTEAALGFTLPHDWNGRVRVAGFGTEVIDGEKVLTTLLPTVAKPEGWGVFAHRHNGNQVMLTSLPTEHQADEMAERLAIIEARSTINEYERVAKLARINEERVRRDPNSTDEDIAAAREVRKDAEFVATTNDEDLQRRIAIEEKARVQQGKATGATPEGNQDIGRVFISVPYKQKEEAKALGAKWDRNEQSWYVPANLGAAPFAQWARQSPNTVAGDSGDAAKETAHVAPVQLTEGRQYLAVPYSERGAARAAGAEWDKVAKSWFAGANADMTKLEQWKPQNVRLQQGPAMTPQEEFTDALKSVGCVISGDHPIMDGKKHRISVEGENFTKNSGSGFYVGHLDGHPAGYIKNNKTGADVTWKFKGYTLDPQQKALMVAEAAEKLRQRDAELSKMQEQAAKRVFKQIGKLVTIKQSTPYLLAKGIEPQAGAFTDKDGKKTYLPAFDADGKQWTMQYIQEDGTKRFAKDSKKEGCFHVVGGMDELTKAPALVICEGYATAATLQQSLGYATVSAFDSGNLAFVAQALHKKFPDKPVVIAGDDDRHLEAVQGINPGRTKAADAAKLVGGKLILPIFAPGESSYPAELAPVTPAMYRQHQKTQDSLSDGQLAALGRMKQFTDFNDLATKSVLGLEGLNRQVSPAIDAFIAMQFNAKVAQQHHERVPGLPLSGDDVSGVPAEKQKRRRTPKPA